MSVEPVVRGVITAVVGGIGAAAGFTHTHDAAVRAGQHGWLAWADAVVIECMVIVAGLQLVRSRGWRWWPGSVLVAAFLVQMGAQVSGAPASFAGWLFAAMPALACLVCVKFALHSAMSTPVDGRQEAVPAGPAVAVESWVDEDQAPVPVREIPAPSLVTDRVSVAAWPPAG